MKLAYVTRTLPKYRHPVMDALAERGTDLTVVVAGSKSDPVRSADQAPARKWRLVAMHSEDAFWRNDVRRFVLSGRPDLVVLEHGARLGFVWTLLLGSTPGVPRVLWTHGIERRERFKRSATPGSILRRIQLNLAQGVLCYDEETAKDLAAQLRGKVVDFARNTVASDVPSELVQDLDALGRKKHRDALGIPDRFYAIGLGRLIPEKGFHRVAEIIRVARTQGIDIGAIFVGHGPERHRIEHLCTSAGLRLGIDTFMPGEITDPIELTKWLYAADVCINPGYLGLSVVDCAQVGIPVISARPGPNGPYHSPEWKYVIDGVSGWLSACDSDAEMSGLMCAYLRRSQSERATFERGCRNYAKTQLAIGPMVDGILRTCQSVLSVARRS